MLVHLDKLNQNILEKELKLLQGKLFNAIEIDETNKG